MPENTTRVEFDPQTEMPWRWWMPDSDRGLHVEIGPDGDAGLYQRSTQVGRVSPVHWLGPAEVMWFSSIAEQVMVSSVVYREAS